MSAYPTHDLYGTRKGETRTAIVCAAPLMLAQQVSPRLPAAALYCVGCGAVVEASEDKFAQAQAAARVDGWTPPTEIPPLTVGSLSERARKSLYALAKMRGGKPYHVVGVHDEEVEKMAREGVSDLLPLGFLVADSFPPVLTPEGEAMARSIVDPPVPPSIADAGTVGDYMGRYADRMKERAPKPRPVAPSLPMTCGCGCPPAAHLDRRGVDKEGGPVSVDVPCKVCGPALCAGYHAPGTPEPAEVAPVAVEPTRAPRKPRKAKAPPVAP